MTVHALPSPATNADCVLGAMLLAPRMIDDICEIIHGEDFRDQRDEIVFNAIVAMQASGTPVDAVTVTDHLRATGDLERIGGPARLHAAITATPSAANGPWYAQRIRDEAILRRVAEVGSRMAQMGQESTATGDEVLDLVNAARAELDALTIVDPVDVPNEQAVYDAIAALEEPPGMPTPWERLTDVVAGLKPGGFYVIAARPAVGKTIVGQAFALDCARRGKAALLVSLEMTRTEIYHRMLSAVGEVDMGRIQKRSLARTDHERLAKAAAHVAGLSRRLVVDDRSSLSVSQIRAKARAMKRRGELGVVVVDYLGLVRPVANRSGDRRVEVDGISRGLKELAKDLRVPVVALAQLNRGSEARMGRRPIMSDLRESGQIEADADVVILLHRDTEDPADLGSTLHLIVAKNRHGPTRDIELAFQGRFSRATEDTNQREY